MQVNRYTNITADSPRVATPAAFRIPLQPTQAAQVHAMIMLERYRQLPLPSGIIYTRGGRLSSQLGSGKTATMIALIHLNPGLRCNTTATVPIRCDKDSLTPIILQRTSRVYRPTVVFVSSTVVNQWEREIAKFCPSLRCCVISDIRTLRDFYHNVFGHPAMDTYNVILVKNKVITGAWTWEHGEHVDPDLEIGSRPIWNMFATICRGICFTRLIVDDFDTINMPGVVYHINAAMTWLVSTTVRDAVRRKWHTGHSSLENLVQYAVTPAARVTTDNLTFKYFNICPSPEFATMDSTVGLTQYFIYRFRHAAQKMAKLISFMPSNKVSEIMEALNGDSYERAAEIAGIKTASPSAVFRKLFQESYDDMVESTRMLQLLSERYKGYLTQTGWETLALWSTHPNPENDSFTLTDIRAGRVPAYRYPGLSSMIREELDKWTDIKQRTSTSLARFRDSVTGDQCGICSMELTGSGNCILPCCYEMLHADCAARGCNFSTQLYMGNRANIGQCPYDKSHQVFYEQLIFVGSEFDLSTLASIPIETKDEKKSSATSPSAGPSVDNTKYSVLSDILFSRTPSCRESNTIRVAGVSVSAVDLGQPQYIRIWAQMRAAMHGIPTAAVRKIAGWISPDAVPRVLIFSSFDEGLDKLQDHLKKEMITYCRLQGTSEQLDAKAIHFETGRVTCLLINSMNNCAGRNFQMATDTIQMHYVAEYGAPSIFPQSVGRMVRNGRTCNARHHNLLYESEVNVFLTTYA